MVNSVRRSRASKPGGRWSVVWCGVNGEYINNGFVLQAKRMKIRGLLLF